MTCPSCTTELRDGVCPMCIAYSKQPAPRYAEGQVMDFSDLTDREREVFTRRMGDSACLQ